MQASDQCRLGARQGRGDGFGILIVILSAIVAVEALTTLCVSENATWADAPPTVVLLLAPLTAMAGHTVTVLRAQLTPVLLSAIVVIPEAIVIGLIWR